MQEITFSSASSTLSTYQPIEINGKSPSLRNDGAGVLRATGYAAASAAGDTATIELALVKNGERVGYFEGTATTVSQQEGSNYLVTIAWDDSSSSKIDLLLCSGYSIAELGGQQNSDKYVWYIGAPSFSGITSLTLLLEAGPV